MLNLGDRPVNSIMSPRNEIEWLDLDQGGQTLRDDIRRLNHGRVVLARGRVDDFVGVAVTKELLNRVIDGGAVDWSRAALQPVIVHESTDVLKVIEQLRLSPVQMAMVVDEHGSLEGIATPTDVLEAIAGEFPDMDENAAVVERNEDGSWLVDGFVDIRRISGVLERDLTDGANRYSTLGGYILARLGHLPVPGEILDAGDMLFEVLTLDKRSIGKVRISPPTPLET